LLRCRIAARQASRSEACISAHPQLLSAAKLDPKLAEELKMKVAGGPEPKNFGYLAQSGTYSLTNVKDSDEFDKLKAALAAFDIVGDVRTACCVLLLPAAQTC
jgi:hypothetical protein